MDPVFILSERCSGCKQYGVACAVAHSQTNILFWAVFETHLPKNRIHTESSIQMNPFFPNKCRHFNPLPCQLVCPNVAFHRPADVPEAVRVEAYKCVACALFSLVCPSDVITYHAPVAASGKGQVAIKCDQCIERQRLGYVPVCVEA